MSFLILILSFAAAITVHEAAHAWMANKLGDPTAKLMGRLSLNPLVHYDTIGTTLLLVTMFLWRLGMVPFPFGWAKAVMFDPFNLKDPRKDSAIISLAGPLANLILALFASLLIRIVGSPFSPIYLLRDLLEPFIVLNVSLAIFNLIPVHPLDGGKIIIGLLPEKEAREVELFLNRFGILILFFLLFPTFGNRSPLSIIIFPIINIFLNLLLPGNNII